MKKTSIVSPCCHEEENVQELLCFACAAGDRGRADQLLMQVSTPFRFLVVGAFNFAFGYGVFALFWWLWGAVWPDWLVILVTTVIGITESYLAHRFITYRAHGTWWREYLRFYVVYGVQTAVNMGVIRLCVTTLGWNAYAVQFVTLVSLTVASYWAHKLYSFGESTPQLRLA